MMLVSKRGVYHGAVRLCCMAILLLSPHGVSAQAKGSFPLHAAVRDQNLETSAKLIAAGADVNQRDTKGDAPLHLASVLRDPSIAAALVDAGSDVNQGNAKGQRPLHLAAYQGRTKIVEILLEHGAQVSLLTKYKESALHYAARGGRVELCVLLMKSGLQPNARTVSGNTALHEAIIGRKLNTTELFASRLPLLGARNRDGMTPLELAQKVDFGEALWPLMDADGRPNKARFDAAFVYAIEHDMPQSMTALLSRGVKPEDYPGRYVKGLYHAAELGHVAVLKCMLDSGANPNMSMELPKWTPMHFAAAAGRVSTINVLKEYGANVDAKTAAQDTPLHLAARVGNGPAARRLMELGADANAVDDRGRTPLHLAVHARKVKLVPILVAQGADPDRTDDAGNSPLRDAYESKAAGMVAAMRPGYTPPMPSFTPQQRFTLNAMAKNHDALFSIMDEKDFDPDDALPDGTRYIHVAAMLGDVALIEALLDRGVDVNDQRNRPKWTPLHYAVNSGNVEAVKILLKRGADPNLADVNGITPLHVAGRSHDEPIWTAITQMGGDPTAADMNGDTPDTFRIAAE